MPLAEDAIALILGLNRKIHRAFNRVRELNFSLNGLLGFEDGWYCRYWQNGSDRGRNTSRVSNARACFRPLSEPGMGR
jgi:hypothetical protein